MRLESQGCIRLLRERTRLRRLDVHGFIFLAALVSVAPGTIAETVDKPHLAELSATQFGKLSQAESELIYAAETGTEADCSNFVGENHIIRAKVIAWLCTSPEASKQVSQHGIFISSAEIHGELDLESAIVKSPLRTWRCTFDETILLRNSRLVSVDLRDTSIQDLRGDNLTVKQSVLLSGGFTAHGEVDLSGAMIGGSLDCSNAHFEGVGEALAINLSAIRIGRSIYLSRNFSADGGVNLIAAKIGGDLGCSGGHFVSRGKQRALHADGSEIHGSVFLTIGETFERPFEAEGEVNFVAATIDGTLDCYGGRFISKGDAPALNVSIAKIQGRVGCAYNIRAGQAFEAKGEVLFIGAIIGGPLDCQGGKFVGTGDSPALNADAAQIGSSVFLNYLLTPATQSEGTTKEVHRFEVEGGVRLVQARIGGQLNCRGGKFVGNTHIPALNANSAKIESHVFLDSGSEMDAQQTVDFDSLGEVNFGAATIGRDFICDGSFANNSYSYEALNVNYANIGGSLKLQSRFKAHGEVNLKGAKIGLDLQCSGSLWSPPSFDLLALMADFVSVGGAAHIDAELSGLASFKNVSVSSEFEWAAVYPDAAVLDLRDSKVGQLKNPEESWPQRSNLQLDGLAYEQIVDEREGNAETQLRWLRLQPTERFLPQPYEQLASVFKKEGLDEDARKVMISKNKDHGDHPNGFFEWCWFRVLGDFLVGYGYSPWHAFVLSLIAIGIGALVFYLGRRYDLIRPTEERAYKRVIDATGQRNVSNEYPKFDAFIYSLETFVPLLNLGMGEHWRPNAKRGVKLVGLQKDKPWLVVGKGARDSRGMTAGTMLRWYLWLHIILGWVLTTLWVGGLTGLLKT